MAPANSTMRAALPACGLLFLLLRGRRTWRDLRSLLEPNSGKTRKMLAGVAIIFGFERAVAKALARAGVKLPSSLMAMITAFILLKVLEKARGKEKADEFAALFAPAVDHLGKWMPLYLTPPLVVLPDALSCVSSTGGDGACTTWAKMGGIHSAGWLFTLLTTAAVARRIQDRSSAAAASSTAAEDASGSKACGGSCGGSAAPRNGHRADGICATAPHTPEAAVLNGNGSGGSSIAEASAAAAKALGASAAAAGKTLPATGSACCKGSSTKKSRASLSAAEQAARMRRAWALLTAAALVASPRVGTKPATLAATVLALLLGNSLPASAKRILHPLVVCSVGTGAAVAALGRLDGLGGRDALRAYFSKRGMVSGGAGDLFFGLLGASCTALGFRMFYNRESLQKNLVPLVGSTLVSSLVSLFGTTAAAGAAGLPPVVSLTLAQRSVMSSLGIPAAQVLGGDSALAVAFILVTGVYGASLGQALLDAAGCGKDTPVARGIATGASAHSIGTASLMEDEPEAAAVASVSLCLAGIFHTAVCSVPAAQAVLKRLARA